ncbi:hypothetical protein SUGI_0825540 [Cryptomeria japonica]|nr:hypothetical protein SUGI_0825540 [Cryptomeria japonica]
MDGGLLTISLGSIEKSVKLQKIPSEFDVAWSFVYSKGEEEIFDVASPKPLFRIEEYHRISNTILAKEKWKGRRSVQMELKQARAALKKVYKIRSGTHDSYEIVWQ